jgi:hypothetical protein
MTFAVDLTLLGPMTPNLWNVMGAAHPESGYVVFTGKGHTRLTACQAAITVMRGKVRREYAPQVAEWAQRGLDDLRCQTRDPSAIECQPGQAMYAVIRVGPLGPGQSIT